MVPISRETFDPRGHGRPLRVLLACLHHDYGDRRRGVSYEWTAFRDPLWRLGCEVLEAPIDDLYRRRGSTGVAEQLTQICVRHAPDLVLFIPFEFEWRPEDVGALRDRFGVPIVAWFSDDHWRFRDHTRLFLPHISVALTTYRAGIAAYGEHGFERGYLTQWGVNEQVFRPLPVARSVDVSFVGQPHSDRRLLVECLRRAGISVETRGKGWPEGRASLAEFVTLSNRSRVCVNFGGASVGVAAQVKGRDFEIPAMGRPMVTYRFTDIGEYFSESEVVTYATGDDLVDAVRFLLADEARAESIGSAGRARVLKDHRAEVRLAGVLTELCRRGWLN